MSRPIQFTPPKTPNMLQMLRQGGGSTSAALPVPYPDVQSQTAPTVQPAATPESAALSSKLTALEQPPSTRQSLLDAVLAFAPTAAAGLAGGLPAAAGAAQGVNAGFASQNAQNLAERKSLIEQVEAARQREQQSGQFAAGQGLRREELAAQDTRNANTITAENQRNATTVAAENERARLTREQTANKPIELSPGTGLMRPGETTPGYTQPFAPKTETPPPTTRTDQGVMQWNPITKKYDTRVGGIPKTGNSDSLDLRREARIDAIRGQYNSNPIVKTFEKVSQATEFAKNLDPNTKNPSDDQGLIYSFAKAMDPDSAVRDGEYATVQKYAQSWAERFGFNAARIFSNTSFLTPEARTNMKATILQRAKPITDQYGTVRADFARRIQNVGGTEEDIPNYGPQTPPSQSGPKPGDVEDGFVFQGGDPANPMSWKKK